MSVKELDIFIRSDGVQYLLGDTRDRQVMSIEGDGMPPIEYITERAPYQDGESVRGFFLRPRILQYLIRQKFCSRDVYWQGRTTLLDQIRPNRGQGTLRRLLSNGEYRDLDVRILEGPMFRARALDQWEEWTIGEVLRFISHYPVYYDPTQRAVAFSSGGGLTFPITFPITFAGFGFTQAVDYLGSWKEFPAIRVDGPITSASIYNALIDESIGITYTLPAGRYLTFTLTPGGKSVLLDDGTDLIGYLDATSDLATWRLEPGVNNISVTVSGDGASTAVSITYYHRFIGLGG